VREVFFSLLFLLTFFFSFSPFPPFPPPACSWDDSILFPFYLFSSFSQVASFFLALMLMARHPRPSRFPFLFGCFLFPQQSPFIATASLSLFFEPCVRWTLRFALIRLAVSPATPLFFLADPPLSSFVVIYARNALASKIHYDPGYRVSALPGGTLDLSSRISSPFFFLLVFKTPRAALVCSLSLGPRMVLSFPSSNSRYGEQIRLSDPLFPQMVLF